MARKFLFVIAGVIVLVLAAGIAWTLFSAQLMRLALVPGTNFVAQRALPPGAYDNAGMWFSRPGLQGDPSKWLPGGAAPSPPGPAAVFYIHPTSYLDRARWNAPLDDTTANDRARLFIRAQATVFSAAGAVWAPRYRQATFGAFLTGKPEARSALDTAYADILLAWDSFLAQAGPDRPIILAGHSQGALHLMHLLRDRIAGQPVARRIVAAYVVGWPVSIAHDLPAMGLPACTTAVESGCILAWQSFAEPADASLVTALYDRSTGFDAHSRAHSPMLCTNPLTGVPGGVAPATANHGTLVPSLDFRGGTLEPGLVPARCGPSGFLLIGPPPAGIGRYVLPGNNYHVFDYSLFWANLRADVDRRLATFRARK